MLFRMSALLASACMMIGCDSSAASGSTDGKSLYQEVCSRCHGSGGKPSPSLVARIGVKDLTSPALQARLDIEAIEKQIRNGSKNRQMPAFQGALSDAQLKALAEYVKTLGAAAPGNAPAPAAKTAPTAPQGK